MKMDKEGMDLIQQGNVEEGLAKLAAAAKAAPNDLALRNDYLRNRELAIDQLLFSAGQERIAGRFDSAQELYDKILRIAPDNANAKLGLKELAEDRRKDAIVAKAEELFKNGDIDKAADIIKPVLLEDPKNTRANNLQRQIDDRKLMTKATEPKLGPQFSKPVTLQFRDANLKMVFEALSRTNGINILLDKDIRPDLKTTIFVKDASVEDTIDLILMQNQLEKKILSDNTVFIYPDTPAKLKDYQDLKIRSFHLVHADPKQMLTMIKTILKTKDIFVDEATNSIVMRDTPDAIRLAERLVADQDIEEPEVMLEVEVLEVTRSHLSDLGITWPDTFAVSTPSSVTTLGQMGHLHGGDLLATPLSATLKLHLDEGDTKVLASPRIRVRNREKAKIMVGSRVPVITNSVTPVSTGSPVITGTVQYLDVGLKLDVEPDVQSDNQVIIKLGMDVSSIIKEVDNAVSGTVAYQIGTRNAQTVLRLKDGETQILGGLIDNEDRKTATEVPLLGKIPILGALFGDHSNDKTNSEIILSITPHLIGGSPPPKASNLEYWTGTENTLRNGQFNIQSGASIALAATSSGPGSPAAVAISPWHARLLSSGRNSLQAVTGSSPTSVQSQPMQLSWQGPAQVKPGETVRLTLNGESIQVVHGMKLAVNYDPNVFKAIDVSEGGFLRQNNMQSTFSKNIDQANGLVQLDVSGTGTAGASGSGTIATLIFQALDNKGESQISVSQITPVAPGGEPVSTNTIEPFTITVSP
jgi:general secretion pathway protein D